MYINAETCFVTSNVASQSSGTKTIKQSDGVVDINELLELLVDPSKFVVIDNYIGDVSETTLHQFLFCQGELKPEEGFTHTYIFASYNRTLSAVANRKVMMSFKGEGKNAEIKCTYYSS